MDCNGTLTRNVNVTNLIGNVTVNIDTTGPANVDLTGQDVTLNILNSATQVTNNSGTSAILIVSTGNVNVTNEVQLSGVAVFGRINDINDINGSNGRNDLNFTSTVAIPSTQFAALNFLTPNSDTNINVTDVSGDINAIVIRNGIRNGNSAGDISITSTGTISSFGPSRLTRPSDAIDINHRGGAGDITLNVHDVISENARAIHIAVSYTHLTLPTILRV